MHRSNQVTALVGPVLVLWLALFSASAISQFVATTGNVTQDMIDATVEAVNDDASLPDATRDDLLATLAVASKNLDTASQQLQRDKDLRQAIFQRTLLKIPEDCQKILRLTGQDITSKEIARQLGFRSETYVRKRRHFCKEFLINKIKEDPDYQSMMED